MPIRLIAAGLLLLAQTAAAGNKSAGNLTVLGDASEFSSGAMGQGGAGLSMDGALGGVAYSSPSAGNLVLESGFYSRMAMAPNAFEFNGVSTGSYSLSWAASNPLGTTYEVNISTWVQADPYVAYYTTDAYGLPVENLLGNTSFYSFAYANYMDGDYSARVSTTGATLAVKPSTGAFTLADAGHNSISLSFTGFDNQPPVTGASWDPAGPPLPAARYGQASVVYGSHVFISGGFNGVSFSSAVLLGSIGAGGAIAGWQSAGFMPASRYGHQLIAARGRLYLLGGYDSSGAHAQVWSADISTSGALGTWEPEAPLSAPVYFHAAALVGARIYVSGGYDSTNSSVLTYIEYAELGNDGKLGAWSPSAPYLDYPRYAHSMTYLPGWLYVIGGKDGASARSEVWASQVNAAGERVGGWLPQAALPAPRYGHKTLAAANRLYVLGGNNGFSAAAQVFQAAAAANAQLSPWQGYNQLPFARQFPAAEIIGETLYVFGGSDGSAAKNDVAVSTVSGTQYLLQVSSDNAFAADVRSSGWVSGAGWSFGGLLPSVTYYYHAKARNWIGLETAYSDVGSTITYAAIPGTAPWTEIGVDSAVAHWLPMDNPPGYDYQVEYSTSADFYPHSTTQTPYSSATLPGMLQNTTYYAQVRVFNAFGRSSRFILLPPVRTTYDPALDTSSPTLVDNQADFTSWKATNTFTCDVDWTDTGGGGLDRFEVLVTTNSDGKTGIVHGWETAASGIDQDSYTQDWPLPQAVWDDLPDGASCYFSVRAWDNVGNSSTTGVLFSLVKDTTPAAALITYSIPALWYSDYPGDVTGLNFSDALSGLQRVQYSVSAGKSFADGAVIPWTTMPGLTAGDKSYAPTLTYNFSLLANGVSNYFSFRAVDVAGSTITFVDQFGIGKNISGPVVTISTPAMAYLSIFTLVSGNALPTNFHAVEGTEVYLRDMASGLYYNNGAFLSGARVWQDAEDAASTFTITFANLPLEHGRQYRLVARSSDSVGDYSQVYATRTFSFDALPPAARVVSPADGSAAYTIASISGTAADPVSGVSGVDITLQRLSDGKWWKNSVSEWSAVPEPLRAGTTPYWTWNFNSFLRDSLADGASYYATVRASDAAWPVNTGEFGASGSTFTYYDVTPPPQTGTLAAAEGPLSGSVLLSWRAAGSNAASGYLLGGTFKIAYSTYAAAEVSTVTAQVTIATGTLTAGTTQFALVTGLVPSSQYYFRLWTADEVPNWSLPSNQAASPAGNLNDGELTGVITDAAAQPVTGVRVEAIGPSGGVEGGDFTDVYGKYAIPGLNSPLYTVRAVWAAEDIESSVSKDGVANGSGGVNFTLSVSYQLASISGFIPANFLPKTSAARPAGARYTTRAVSAASGSPAFVEVYSRGRRIGAAYADARGAFEVPNLLPGTYSLRVFNGAVYSKMETIVLRPGQALAFTPKWDLLDKGGVFAYPNPANTLVNFHFSPSAVSFEAVVEVFDISGRLVKTLKEVSAEPPAVGGSRIAWNFGRESVASGVYLYILRVRDLAGGGDVKVVKKFAVIR